MLQLFAGTYLAFTMHFALYLIILFACLKPSSFADGGILASTS